MLIQQSKQMPSNQKTRWGILVIASLMFLATLFFGTKATPYGLFWIWIGYLSFKGDIERIHRWLKYILITNVVIIWIVLSHFDSSMLSLMNFQTKRDFFLASLFPMAIKLGLYLYILTPLSKLPPVEDKSSTNLRTNLADTSNISGLSHDNGSERASGKQVNFSSHQEKLGTVQLLQKRLGAIEQNMTAEAKTALRLEFYRYEAHRSMTNRVAVLTSLGGSFSWNPNQVGISCKVRFLDSEFENMSVHDFEKWFNQVIFPITVEVLKR